MLYAISHRQVFGHRSAKLFNGFTHLSHLDHFEDILEMVLHLVLTIGTGFFRFFNSFLLPIPPFSSIRQQKKAPRVISVPLMSGVLRFSNVAFSALLRITLQPFALHSKRAVVHSKESSATSKESRGAFPYLLLSVQLVVDTKKEDERIDNAEQIDHCEANEAAQ